MSICACTRPLHRVNLTEQLHSLRPVLRCRFTPAGDAGVIVKNETNMSFLIADKEWYRERSKTESLSMHCPYATVGLCPRYYQSLSLLSETGATSIDDKEDRKLLKKWEKSDLWPQVMEHSTSVSSGDGKFLGFSNFCPEVSNDRFGIFVRSLHSFPEESDQERMHTYLKSIGAPETDVRWLWHYAEALHFSECPLYSVLSNKGERKEVPWWREHLAKIIVGSVLAIVTGFVTWLFR